MFGEEEAARYDAVPYPNAVYPASHPERLWANARLHGLDVPDVRTARVLELGCAAGVNLMAMAEQLPDARFVGVDLSGAQVAAGHLALDALGLDNVSLLARDLTTLDRDFGRFDYILAHGLYSWVPVEVRGHILRIFSELLTPEGVAYVSYNTNPGWHMRGMVREMMLYHTAPYDEPHEKIAQAHALLGFLTGAVSADKPYGALLRQEVELLADLPETHQSQYVFHDHLATINEPLWFHEFAAELDVAGLAYVCESDLWRQRPSQLQPEVAEALLHLRGDVIRTEQYLDFVANRHFRKSVVVASARHLARELDATVVKDMHVAGPTRADGPIDLSPGVECRFKSLEDNLVRVSDPLLKATFGILGEIWPCSMSVAELSEEAARRAGQGGAADGLVQRIVGNEMAEAYRHGLVELLAAERRCVSQASDRPTASPLARWLARDEVDSVPSRGHRSVHVDDLGRAMVRLLDGTRTLDEVRGSLVELAQGEELEVFMDGEVVRDPVMLDDAFAELMPAMMDRLLSSAVIIS